MKELRAIIITMLILTGVMWWYLISDYEEIDNYNQTTNNYRWISDLGNGVEYVSFMGNDEQCYIKVDRSKGTGIIDKNGITILPNQFEDVEYKGGEYMAAATNEHWILKDLDGEDVGFLNRISYLYSYAGDKYFIQYGDDAFKDSSDGFVIIDAVSGKTVKEYNDYYNAMRLDDGNWYISKTLDTEGILTRMILMQNDVYSGEYPEEESEPYGFFTDENFEPLYEGKEYQLICQGDGLYVAKDTDANGDESYIVLDKDGELFRAEDKNLIDRFEEYEWTGNYINDTLTVFKNEDGNIGFASINNIYDIVYYGKDGNYNGTNELSENSYAIGNKNLIVFTEEEKDEYGTSIKYGIKDKNNNVVLPASYYELIFLPGTDNIMVNSSMGCGIIRLEVN